jgi:hypothetical protein
MHLINWGKQLMKTQKFQQTEIMNDLIDVQVGKLMEAENVRLRDTPAEGTRTPRSFVRWFDDDRDFPGDDFRISQANDVGLLIQ